MEQMSTRSKLKLNEFQKWYFDVNNCNDHDHQEVINIKMMIIHNNNT